MLARRVSAEGRTRAYVGGRAATAADLRELGGRLRRLLRSARAPQAHGRVRPARAARRLLRRRPSGPSRSDGGVARARARAGSRAASRCALGSAPATATSTCCGSSWRRSRRSRPRRKRRTCWPPSASGCARSTGFGPPPAPGARPSPRRPPTRPARRCSSPRPSGVADSVSGADPELDELIGRLGALRIEAEELGGELRRYLDVARRRSRRACRRSRSAWTASTGVKRKHGGSVRAVLEHAERCRAECDRLENAEEAIEQARGGAVGGRAAARASWRPS